MIAGRQLAMMSVFSKPMLRGVALAVGLLTGCSTVREPDYDTLIAHRGESFDAPENTMPAYRMAVDRGFGFECDIYLSTDGRCYTFHDVDLARTTGGANTNRCCDVDWKMVEKLNVAGWGQWKGSKYDPTRPALLEEVLALARPGRKIYVEIKTGPEIVPFVKKVMEREAKATPDTVLFISFNAESCRALKRDLPAYKVYLLDGGRPWTCNPETNEWEPGLPYAAEELIARVRACGADGIDLCFIPEVHDCAFVKAFHDAGLEFHVWTIDDPAFAAEAFRRGAETVTTNRAKYILDSLGPTRKD